MNKKSALKSNVRSKKTETKRGRKPIRISKVKAAEYLRLGLSVRDIAKIFEVDEKTIRNKFSAEIKKRNNDNILEQNDKKRKLLDKQFEVAMEGNPILLIWLGKNWLNQKDRIENTERGAIKLIKEEIKQN